MKFKKLKFTNSRITSRVIIGENVSRMGQFNPLIHKKLKRKDFDEELNYWYYCQDLALYWISQWSRTVEHLRADQLMLDDDWPSPDDD